MIMTKTEKTTLIRSESNDKHQIMWADWISCPKASFHICSIHSTCPCLTVSDSDLTRSKTPFRCATLKNRVAHSIQIYANIPEALFLSSKSGVFNPMSFMDSVRICDGFESGLKARFQKPAHETNT